MQSLSAVSVGSYNETAYSRPDVTEQERVQSGRQFIASLMPSDSEKTKAEDAGSVQAVPKVEQKRQVTKAIDTVSQFAEVQNLKLQFTSEEHNGVFVVKVVDQDSKKVIRQIPSQEFLKVAEKIQDIVETTDQVKGLLFESKV
jgi:flagellar protein FlaG